MGKNKKPMLTVLVEGEKLQRLRDYALSEGLSMGAIVNQLIDRLLSEGSSTVSTGFTNSIEKKNNNSIDIDIKSIEIMIATSIDKYHKSVEEMITISIEGNHKSIEEAIFNSTNNHHEILEELVISSIGNYAKALPPTLSLQDVDRLIGSAMSTVTKANDEVVTELRNKIKHQETEIFEVSKIVMDLINIVDSRQLPKPEQTRNSLSWGEFCELIDEPLPIERNKANGDKMTVMASNKGFSGWKYNGNSKKFTLG